MSKPKFLYHASPKCSLKKIEPRNETAPEGFDNGPVVFATDDFAFATQFLVPHDDSWANGGAIGGIPFFVISNRNKFITKDNGGSIYLVSSKKFTKFNKKEYVSEESVETESEVCFSSGLDAMIINGVQVYFVNKGLYKKIQSSPDHGAKVMNGLISENEKRVLKVKKLDIYKGSKKRI
jgi:hypothetical protein